MTFFTCNDCGKTLELDDGKTQQKTGWCWDCYPNEWMNGNIQQIFVINLLEGNT